MKRGISIRTSLLRNLVAMILVMGGAILVTTIVGSRGIARTTAELLVDRTEEAVAARLEGFFAMPEHQLDVLLAQAARGLLDPPRDAPDADAGDDDAAVAAVRDQRNRMMVPIVRTSDRVSSIMVADGRGREHMVLELAGLWKQRETRRDTWDTSVRWLEWSDGVAPVEHQETLDYDPRGRPWFVSAVKASPAVDWTDPYIFFTTKEPGITLSATYTLDPDDGIERVIGFDVRLAAISEFTESLRIGTRGCVAVMTESDRLIGLPADVGADIIADPQDAFLKQPRDIGLTLMADIVAAFESEGTDASMTHRFESGDEAWWGRVSPFDLSPDRRLHIAIVIPEADILGTLPLQRQVILGVLLGVFLFGIIRAMIMARRFSAPVEAIVAESARIGRGEFEPGPRVVSRVKEIRSLARAQDRLREGLRALVKLEKIEHDLDLARDIQQGLLPSEPPVLAGFEVAGWNKPADRTGGDYYDWLVIPDGRAAVTLADVSGHGIAPALIVAVCRAYMRASTSLGATHLAEALQLVNDLLFADMPPERFVTAVVAMLDPRDGSLTMCSAGHGPLLFYDAAADTVHSWGADAPPLGVMEGLPIEEGRHLIMRSGDLLVLTTDGFFEWANPEGEMYGTGRLEAFTREHRHLAPEQFIQELYREVLDHAEGTEQLDDLTAVIVRRV